jgi:hypothetical protein
MSGDGQAEKPAVLRETVQLSQAPSRHQTPTDPASADKRPRFTSKHWRLIVLLAILLIAVRSGFYFKSHANPGTEPSKFGTQPSQFLDIYDTNTNDHVSVSVFLYQGGSLSGVFADVPKLQRQGFTYFTEDASITVTPARSHRPGTVMMTSSTQPANSPAESLAGSGPAFPLKSYGPSEKSRRFATTIIHAQPFVIPVHLYRTGDSWFGDVFFNSIPIIFRDNGTTYGNLPSVGALGSAFAAVGSRLEAEYRQYQLEKVFLRIDAGAGLGLKPLKGPSIPPGFHAKQFGIPVDTISYTEVLDNLAPLFRNEQVDYMDPNVINGGAINYAWRGKGGLEPVFKITDLNVADSQSQAAFTSGIAFGVAGAAAIALVQELPKELAGPSRWPRLKRRRKSSPQNGKPSP